MDTSSAPPSLNINWLEGVMVVDFVDPHIVDPKSIRAVSERLSELLDLSTEFVLDFGNVRQFGSAMIGELIGFLKKVQLRGGRMALCSINPQVHGVFKLFRLDSLFSIYPDVRSAFDAVSA